MRDGCLRNQMQTAADEGEAELMKAFKSKNRKK